MGVLGVINCLSSKTEKLPPWVCQKPLTIQTPSCSPPPSLFSSCTFLSHMDTIIWPLVSDEQRACKQRLGEGVMGASVGEACRQIISLGCESYPQCLHYFLTPPHPPTWKNKRLHLCGHQHLCGFCSKNKSGTPGERAEKMYFSTERLQAQLWDNRKSGSLEGGDLY